VGIFISSDPLSIRGGFNTYAYVHDPNAWVDVFGLEGDQGFLFRGDNGYHLGDDVGLPLGSEADIETPWEHVRRESRGETSRFTSYSEKRNKAAKFGKTTKVSMADLKALEAEGKIKIHTPESVAEMMKSSTDKKIKRDANNVKQIMANNAEILIEGTIPGNLIKACN
jgi:uncharacterized protein RhaS with RHS repeats